jgi:hypothetical protein
MVHFHTKQPNFGIVREASEFDISGILCGHLVYLVSIWYVLWPFGIFCGPYCVVIWYIFSTFEMRRPEKEIGEQQDWQTCVQL